MKASLSIDRLVDPLTSTSKLLPKKVIDYLTHFFLWKPRDFFAEYHCLMECILLDLRASDQVLSALDAKLCPLLVLVSDVTPE